MSIPVQIPGGDLVEGTHPLIVIGPNGSGKTRFGAELVGLNEGRGAEMIGAVRNLQIQDSLPVQSVEQARTQ